MRNFLCSFGGIQYQLCGGFEYFVNEFQLQTSEGICLFVCFFRSLVFKRFHTGFKHTTLGLGVYSMIYHDPIRSLNSCCSKIRWDSMFVFLVSHRGAW